MGGAVRGLLHVEGFLILWKLLQTVLEVILGQSKVKARVKKIPLVLATIVL